MSLGLASQGILHNTGFAPHPSSSRCVSCLQLYSCSEHTSLSSSPLSMQCCITSSLEVKASIQSNVHEPSTSLPPLAAFIPPPVLDQQSCIYTVLHLNISAESQSWTAPLHTLSPHIPPNPHAPTAKLPLACRPLSVPEGQIKVPGRKLPIFPGVYNDSVLSPLWADAFSFIITFSKTMLMFVLCMKCLHNSLLEVLHSSYYTQLFFWNQESNRRWSQICPGPNSITLKLTDFYLLWWAWKWWDGLRVVFWLSSPNDTSKNNSELAGGLDSQPQGTSWWQSCSHPTHGMTVMAALNLLHVMSLEGLGLLVHWLRHHVLGC